MSFTLRDYHYTDVVVDDCCHHGTRALAPIVAHYFLARRKRFRSSLAHAWWLPAKRKLGSDRSGDYFSPLLS